MFVLSIATFTFTFTLSTPLLLGAISTIFQLVAISARNVSRMKKFEKRSVNLFPKFLFYCRIFNTYGIFRFLGISVLWMGHI